VTDARSAPNNHARLHPDKVTNVEMGYLYEEAVRTANEEERTDGFGLRPNERKAAVGLPSSAPPSS
jgi:hypothetical protein